MLIRSHKISIILSSYMALLSLTYWKYSILSCIQCARFCEALVEIVFGAGFNSPKFLPGFPSLPEEERVGKT
jgi:hypothetical protein